MNTTTGQTLTVKSKTIEAQDLRPGDTVKIVKPGLNAAATARAVTVYHDRVSVTHERADGTIDRTTFGRTDLVTIADPA